jgi:hypothetical protein
MARKQLRCLSIPRHHGIARVDHGVLDIRVPYTVLHKGHIGSRMRNVASLSSFRTRVRICSRGAGALCRQLTDHLRGAGHGTSDVIMVWRLDRWRRSLADLVVTLKALLTSGIPPSMSRRLGTYLRRVRRLFKACRERPSMPAARP